MRPGDRRRRWKQSCRAEETIFFVLSVISAAAAWGGGIEPSVAGWIAAIFFGVMCLRANQDARRGWRIRYDLPPWGRHAIARGDPVAGEAWEATQRKARDPNRKRFAFDD